MSVSPRVALVHERLTELGGSEKVVDVLAQSFGVDSLFIPISDRRGMGLGLDELRHDTSPLQRLYRHDGRYSHLLPLLPASFRAFDPGDADAVVVSHHAFANRVAFSVSDRPVISYVHSPARWMWDQRFAAAEAPSAAAFRVLQAFSATQRPLDRKAAQKVTELVANSTEVANRIQRWWGRAATVVSPPIDATFFHVDSSVEREDFFLYAGRMTGYKNPDVAILAARKAGVQLVIAGDGRELEKCRALAGPETTFVGSVNNTELRSLFQRCRALIFPGLEDFGMIPVEAQATGAPVLGLGQGGIRDSVVDGVTGQWIGADVEMDDSDGLVRAFAEALADFDSSAYDSRTIRDHSAGFDTSVFTAKMKKIVDSQLS